MLVFHQLVYDSHQGLCVPLCADYPSIRAISTFIVDTKHPGGLATGASLAPTAGSHKTRLVAATAGAEAASTAAVALTGFKVRAAQVASLAQLYTHMRDGTELHSIAPYTR